MTQNSLYRAAIYGAAVGDALGVPYEFLQAGTYTCTGMASGGVHNQPKGTFSDDTSMLLATCDSLREKNVIDIADMREKFNNWAHHGAYAVNGVVFDIGNTVASALSEGQGRSHEWSNGNGSLMRIAPLAFFDVTEDEVRAVSAITHAHSLSTESCVLFVNLLKNIVQGLSFEEALKKALPEDERFAFLATIGAKHVGEVPSSGYVLDTLGAAIWCVENTNSYADCVLAAVNLGHDSDTTACVAGALAGTIYGYEAIPKEWLADLRGKDLIEAVL